ncbi:hypothetical protein [Pelomonas sp. SE-A7]|uniref:hypothetical protein n=1 Tax=Pelomonas sp. SE-A7 TaxID=3054953 RepID=UPI00259D0BFA|nr:hypothetical protein [Pelomonas sp. SE-A7]MDM4768545.1 hypothetical protein [Pelomonas sp. SE-A7]
MRILESRLTPEQEAAAPLPDFAPVVLGLLSIGGAAWGLIAIAMLLLQSWPGLLSALLVGAVAAVFAFGAYVGVLALRRTPGWLRKSTVFWALQIPLVLSPAVSYALASGGYFAVWLQLHPPVKVGANFLLGSTFTLKLLSGGPVVVGVNLFALGIFLFLLRVQAKSAT